jgi:phenylacetate-coenzyme A ligase PaaK-like adenylate-forming protein
MKSIFFYLYSIYTVKKEYYYSLYYEKYQLNILKNIIANSTNTDYKTNIPDNSNTITRYQKNFELTTYESLLPFIKKIQQGKEKVLTQEKIQYLLKTSGTTGGHKYIPITKKGILDQINGAKKVLCFFAFHNKNADFVTKKMIFLQGSPLLDYEYAIPSGRLSGIVYHFVPKFFQKNKLPSYKNNIIENWESKIESIIEEIEKEDLSIIGGIPPWCIQFFEKIIEKRTIENLSKAYPNLTLYIHGGVDFSPYKQKVLKLLGNHVQTLDTFPASEGFFAIQDIPERTDLLLLVNQGIFFEFRPLKQLNSKIVTLSEVALNTNYELIISNMSGLYRYQMGDIIQFTSLAPFRIKVTGRTKQYISAFGEHVIGNEIDQSIAQLIQKHNLIITDFHVCPNVDKKRYEWLIECDPKNQLVSDFINDLDKYLSHQNPYYKHLIDGNIINPCHITILNQNVFQKYRIKYNKLGDQNKVIRLSNDMELYNILIDINKKGA